MNRPLAVVAVVALLIGALAGYLWWGLPSSRLKTELQETQAGDQRLSRQLGELQARTRQLEAQLAEQRTRLEETERDLRAAREMNSRLQLLVSGGKK